MTDCRFFDEFLATENAWEACAYHAEPGRKRACIGVDEDVHSVYVAASRKLARVCPESLTGLIIVSLNEKDFVRFEGLTVQNWSKRLRNLGKYGS